MGIDPVAVFNARRAARRGSFTFSTCRSRRILTSKRAAKAVGEKSIEMIHQKELLPLTGYVHGGCSPVGMKKLFPTVIDASAENLETMIVSAGRIGYQVELSPRDLAAALVRAQNLQISSPNKVDIKNSEEYAGLAACESSNRSYRFMPSKILSKAQERITSRTSTWKSPATR